MYTVTFQYPGTGRKLSRATWLYLEATTDKQARELAEKEIKAKYPWYKIISILPAKNP